MSTQQDDVHDDITLRDVVNHMTQGFQRLEGMIKENGKRIDHNGKRIDQLEHSMNQGFKEVNRKLDSLEEDLEATMSDTHKLKRFAGMVREE